MRTMPEFLEGLTLSDAELDAWAVEDRLYMASTLRRLAEKLENALPERKVRLIGYGTGSKIELLKWIRWSAGLGLKEAKTIVDNLGHTPFELYVTPERKAELIAGDLARFV